MSVSKKKNEKELVKEREVTEAQETMQIVVFKQGDEDYALPIDQIKEVVLTPSMTKMPQTPDYIPGVANIRGNVIAILDLEKKFGLVGNEATDHSKKRFTLVIASDEYKIGILVENVPNTMAVAPSEIEESINVMHDSSVGQNYISGIVKKDNRLVILIDILKILSDGEAKTIAQLNS